MKHLALFPPALGRSLYYAVLAALGALVLLAAAGLVQFPISTSSVWCRNNAPGTLGGSTGSLATAAKLPLTRRLGRRRLVAAERHCLVTILSLHLSA